MNVLAILQARMSSSRLPGKVLQVMVGKPMLALQIERVLASNRIDGLVVATSIEAADDPIERLCAQGKVICYRGSLNDVLDRYYQAAKPYQPTHVLRLTGDCPLTDPALLDALVELHVEGGYAYSSNVHERTYPDGLDAEIFTFSVLAEAWNLARTSFEREHVTPYMYRTGPDLRRGALKDRINRAELRWTVDYPEDFEFVHRIFEQLYPANPHFSTADVHSLLARYPELPLINARHRP